MSDERLEQIQARAAAATPGPWEAWDTGDPPAEDEAQAWIVTPGSLHLATLYAGDPSANATFAAHAREDIPTLLEEIDRLHEEVSGQRSVAEMLARVAEAAHRREDRVRDRLNNIRVVTDEMVEHAAKAMYRQEFGSGWDEDATEDEKDEFWELARRILEAALGGGES
ncbi:MAG: hypothetical protein L0I17_07950 [Actinomycetia bacterium]|nr:hypothetical protein [Actinomycetes bacterium]